jgi:hypothetical protein
MIQYFQDAYFCPHAGLMYIQVYLGSDLTDEELGKSTSGFFFFAKESALHWVLEKPPPV